MSVPAIRAALESRLNTMSPLLATAWANGNYTPVTGTPYQRADLLLATPDNSELAASYQEQGIFQVTLKYPQGTGPNAADLRAKAIREWFPKAMTLTSGGIKVLITNTPYIGNGSADDERYSLPVKILWRAFIP